MEQSKSNNQSTVIDLSKDRFFSVVAHDLKAPLSTIVSLIDVSTRNLDMMDKDDIIRMLASINEEAINTLLLLDNLLQWYHEQQGNVGFNPHMHDVAEMVTEAVREVSGGASLKHISVHYDKMDYRVYADRAMVVTVLRNLLTNAVKFSYEGGSIWVEVVRLSHEIRFIVRDSGVGMPKDVVNKLFDSNKQNSTPGTNNEKGTGIGLLLCKDFVERHGGRIWAESQPGQGSVISFSLPEN